MSRKPCRFLICLCGLYGLSVAATLHAQTSSAPAPSSSADIPMLAAITVTGVQPGPGLWKVSRGEHVLWLLGVATPLPAGMQWQSAEVAQVIAHSQEVIAPPKIKLTADVGFFGKLLLLPSAYGARKNPDGRTLQQVLPPPLYARWQVLKQQYLGSNHGIERWRPLFAAIELDKQAQKQRGLRNANQIQATIDALATQFGVHETHTDYTIAVAHPRDAIAAFKQAGPRDITCFARTLERVEHDLPAMTTRANAWASGDIESLRRTSGSHSRDACVAALSEAGFARQLGINDVPARVAQGWLAAARRALANNAQTFASLPLEQVLDGNGMLARLQAEGYQVFAPDAPPPDQLIESASAPTPATTRMLPTAAKPAPAEKSSTH